MFFPSKSTWAHPKAETPFEKRSREALKKHKDKETAKVLAMKHREARVMIGKIASVLTSIEAIEAVPEFSLLGQELREPLLARKAFLETNGAVAEEIVACEVLDDLPALASSAELLEAAADAKKTVARITNVLAAIARLHR
jgi:hypothetical protein